MTEGRPGWCPTLESSWSLCPYTQSHLGPALLLRGLEEAWEWVKAACTDSNWFTQPGPLRQMSAVKGGGFFHPLPVAWTWWLAHLCILDLSAVVRPRAVNGPGPIMWLYHSTDGKDKLKKSEHGGSELMDAGGLGSTVVDVLGPGQTR